MKELMAKKYVRGLIKALGGDTVLALPYFYNVSSSLHYFNWTMERRRVLFRRV